MNLQLLHSPFTHNRFQYTTRLYFWWISHSGLGKSSFRKV